MRLRLTVQRNNLPASSILWNVPATSSAQAYTISKLLHDVNQVLPLETELWGLEDYIVEVDGYECLHFSPVFSCLKEDDHVSIRPLLTAEVRSRTLCGRHQIAEDGRRLVDGIPFGRPYLRQPSRPSITIPPRKRRRGEHTKSGNDAAAVPESMLLGQHAPAVTSNSLDVGVEVISVANTAELTSLPRKLKRKRNVHFAPEETSHVNTITTRMENMDSSEDDDPDFSLDETESEQEIRAVDLIASSLSPAESVSIEDEDSMVDELTSEASTTTDSVSSSEAASESEDDSSSSDSDEQSEGSVEQMSSKLTIHTAQPTPPGKGSKHTKLRNVRRRQSQQLKVLKEQERLGPDATLEDLRIYIHANGEASKAQFQLPLKGHMIAKPGEDSVSQENELDSASHDAFNELERRKVELMAKFEITPTAGSPIQQPSTTAIPPLQAEVRQNGSDSQHKTTRRLRPNTSAISRMLTHQTRNPDRKINKQAVEASASLNTDEDIRSDPDYWKSKIRLSAFECWDEDFELSAPPFPFRQHWDPASKLMRDKQNGKKQTTKKKLPTTAKQLSPEGVAAGDLGHEDVGMTAVDQLGQAVSGPDQQQEDVEDLDFVVPAFPADVSSLPDALPNHVTIGAIIAFKIWIIDPSTFTPEISGYQVGVVAKAGDSGSGAGVFSMKLAAGDASPLRQTSAIGQDKKTRSRHEGFHINGHHVQEDEATWEGRFSDLVGPKLLAPAS